MFLRDARQPGVVIFAFVGSTLAQIRENRPYKCEDTQQHKSSSVKVRTAKRSKFLLTSLERLLVDKFCCGYFFVWNTKGVLQQTGSCSCFQQDQQVKSFISHVFIKCNATSHLNNCGNPSIKYIRQSESVLQSSSN